MKYCGSCHQISCGDMGSDKWSQFCGDKNETANIVIQTSVNTQEVHHGKSVWTNKIMDELRRQQCLCLNCEKLKSCEVAKRLYETCQKENLAMAITRCPNWLRKGQNKERKENDK